MSGMCWQSEEVPEEERYDGYLQLENGVGMMRLSVQRSTGGALCSAQAMEGSGRFLWLRDV